MTNSLYDPEERNDWPSVERASRPPLQQNGYLPTNGVAGSRVVTGVTICNDGTDEVVDIIVQ